MTARNSTPPPVKYNIERDKTMPESIRKSELASVESVDVIDPLTVRFTLKKPDSTLLAALTDRAGMMVAPEAAKKAGAKFGLSPVCSGPYKFVERVQQDHITLARNPDYWNAKAFSFDKIVFRTITDSTARLASLRSGDLDIVERVEPTDVKELEAQKDFKVTSIVSLGYQGLTVNVANGPQSKTPIGQDKRIRQALSLSIDRQGLMDAVFDGEFIPGFQAVPPVSPYYSDKFPPPKRDLEKAKALLKAAGVEHPVINVRYPPPRATKRSWRSCKPWPPRPASISSSSRRSSRRKCKFKPTATMRSRSSGGRDAPIRTAISILSMCAAAG